MADRCQPWMWKIWDPSMQSIWLTDVSLECDKIWDPSMPCIWLTNVSLDCEIGYQAMVERSPFAEKARYKHRVMEGGSSNCKLQFTKHHLLFGNRRLDVPTCPPNSKKQPWESCFTSRIPPSLEEAAMYCAVCFQQDHILNVHNACIKIPKQTTNTPLTHH